MTFERVLETFGGYLAKDNSCEVLHTSRGYLVVDWESGKNDWVMTQLCRTPERLRDVLCSSFEEYQGFLLTNGYERDLTDQEESDIHQMSAALVERCRKK